MWFGPLFRRRKHSPLFLYNTLTKEKDEFTLPHHVRTVRMYNCGPTVYDVQHIGNLSAFVFADVLRRTLEYNGFSVKQVINITDFGHLTSDADEGDDKMSKGLRREGLALTLENMRVLAERYTAIFLEDLRKLNVDTERITFPRASDYITAQIAMVQTLEEKGYAYRAEDGVYFDTSRFPAYGVLGGINADESGHARIETKARKRNSTDFALWKFDKKIGWDSPWGKGFPGWHIECSAMINATLGKQIDIHTGGIEHIAIHHNNEIAQSESATGKRPLSRFWMHRAHIQLEGGKMAKSEGNVVCLSDIVKRGFHPLALRYLLLGAHYRTPANFTWGALEAAQTSFLKLRQLVDAETQTGMAPIGWQKKIHERLNDDLDTPGALGVMWEMAKDRLLSGADIRAGVLDADKILGLGFDKSDDIAESLCKKMFGVFVDLTDVSERIRKLVEAREAARKEKNWEYADSLRKELQKMNYVVEDTSAGPRLFKKE
ncbi:cysteine--tRNA ligase [Candidatus Kaiserbacteria bacterium RIFCSPHIGHO2_01_FULL_55_17]|uniref:Cysteine--tRNA ligase n=1 Tax=Candidatus Kaiserbacteria bacterium RIFCSPHIGHO2_01_FULL_55_17 TaxID=1798484 RepID=A0A1F6D7B8_9BACT|nr:MAG: cysteine--tRNA ligase [Candidatus Kaiserbacteria bacterium RIFCSPHIGHO2_01_FULL_55_17]